MAPSWAESRLLQLCRVRHHERMIAMHLLARAAKHVHTRVEHGRAWCQQVTITANKQSRPNLVGRWSLFNDARQRVGEEELNVVPQLHTARLGAGGRRRRWRGWRRWGR